MGVLGEEIKDFLASLLDGSGGGLEGVGEKGAAGGDVVGVS